MSGIKRITPEEFFEMDEDVLVLDLRRQEEIDAGGIIEGALHIPFTQIGERFDELPMDHPVCVLCQVGIASQDITEFLCDEGFDAFDVIGGFEALEALAEEG